MSSSLQNCIDALAHHRAGRANVAEAGYRETLSAESEFNPIRKRALHGLALLLLQNRREIEAASLWREIVAGDPRDLGALVSLATTLYACERNNESIAACDRALAIDNECIAAFTVRSRALIAVGRVDDAVAYCRMAVGIRSDDAMAHATLAVALLHGGDPAGAVLAADAAVTLDPDLAEGWFARGMAAAALRSWKPAISAFERAIEIAPDHALAQLNLANILSDLDRSQEAEFWLRKAVEADPRLAEAFANLGALLSADGRLIEAVHHCEEAVRLRPFYAEAHCSLAVANLLAGDYSAGWRGFVWRNRHPGFMNDYPALPGKQWQGENLAGKTLLVRAEQAIGDTIQFARFLPVLAAKGTKVVLACAASVTTLLAQLCPTVSTEMPLPSYDYWMDMISLPGLLAVPARDIVGARGYLRAPPFKRQPRISRPHVGIVAAGNPDHPNDRRRSIPTAELAPIITGEIFVFTNLQVGQRSHEIATRYGLPDRSAELVDFSATAKLVAELDLVITVDTAVAHLAGAMGRPTYLMLPYAPDWRWMIARGDSPWYDSITIFRQPIPGDWSSVAQMVAAAMKRRFAKRA